MQARPETAKRDRTPDYLTPQIRRWRAYSDTPLLVIAIGSLPLLLLELERGDLPKADRLLLDLVNVLVLVAFAGDYIVELILARRRGSYVRHEWTSALIAIAQAMALIPGLTALGFLRIFRGGPLLRVIIVLARVVAIGGAAAHEGRSVLRKHAAGFAIGLAGLTWVSSAVAFVLFEDVGTGQRLESFFDALWWSTATIATVGYGDITPITAGGRIVGAFEMVVGVSTFAVLTAKVAQFLVRPTVEDPSL